MNVLLSTFQLLNYSLLIAGDGPLVEQVKKVSNESDTITYLGNLDREEVQQGMQTCTALLFPSIWYEGMPMTILEAFSL
ncbi:glycosyltransferase, partial [Spirosoma fluviale]|uniref:glycosyltransferase n=1 Tax=Spirosoma fluviale TaxID=1597977 RepID=UPI001FE712F3